MLPNHKDSVAASSLTEPDKRISQHPALQLSFRVGGAAREAPTAVKSGRGSTGERSGLTATRPRRAHHLCAARCCLRPRSGGPALVFSVLLPVACGHYKSFGPPKFLPNGAQLPDSASHASPRRHPLPTLHSDAARETKRRRVKQLIITLLLRSSRILSI